jgi:hypothetical protein
MACLTERVIPPACYAGNHRWERIDERTRVCRDCGAQLFFSPAPNDEDRIIHRNSEYGWAVLIDGALEGRFDNVAEAQEEIDELRRGGEGANLKIVPCRCVITITRTDAPETFKPGDAT